MGSRTCRIQVSNSTPDVIQSKSMTSTSHGDDKRTRSQLFEVVISIGISGLEVLINDRRGYEPEAQKLRSSERSEVVHGTLPCREAWVKPRVAQTK